MNGCATWNTNATMLCVGVSWLGGTFGPYGEAGGSQCYYKWEMWDPGSQSSGADSARLRDVGPSVNLSVNLLSVLANQQDEYNNFDKRFSQQRHR